MAKHKLVIIGLDGADWRALQPEIDAGRLPVLARLQAEGCFGPLRSTIRPESSVAWSTFATGVNPGKHGIFGFVRHQPGSYHFSLADSRHVGARCFWDYLGDADKRVGLVNVPFTYPPRPVNGFLVGGMLTPGKHVTFTYPRALQEKILARFESYLFDASEGGQDKSMVGARVSAFTQQQVALARWLLTGEAWDCFVVVFTGLDRLQHFFWDTPEHGAHLRQLDDALGGILTVVPDDAIVLVMSDHGFNGVGRRFFVNRWLQQEGYLSLRVSETAVSQLNKLLTRLKTVPLAKQIKRWLLPAEWGPSQLKVATFTQAIDWSRTKLYYAPDGGIRINLKGRELAGIVSPDDYEVLRAEIRDKLLAVRDAQNGRSPIADVYFREALYHGPYAESAPDLIVEPWRTADEPTDNYLIESKLDRETAVFDVSLPYTGNHAPNGILLAWRPGVIAQQSLGESALQDIAPTVLAALDVPIPEYMDGRVLHEMFVAEHRPEPTFVADTAVSPLANQPDIPEEDTSAVEERLRNLGYLD
ncbi:MAG: alkaline phosphatase family protein [Candidatus Promineifilaceae bacterium]